VGDDFSSEGPYVVEDACFGGGSFVW